ncbi:MAG: hypothetical protein J5580_02635 [Clostridia bacterium]|nr:hypothetical protein [Clostridia bacterium]
MKFYKDNNNYYQLSKEDSVLLMKRQFYFYNLLKDNLFDRKNNIKVLSELLNDIKNEEKNSSFPERDIYINESNYKERNKRAIIFFPLFISYGGALIRSYNDYIKNKDKNIFNIEDKEIEVMDLKGRIKEIEREFKKALIFNVNYPQYNTPTYGTTMLIISIIERAICNNLINKVFKDFIQQLNGKIKLEPQKEVVWNAGIQVFIKEETPEAFKDIDDFEKELVDIFFQNSDLLNLNSRARNDLLQLIDKTPPTLNSLFNNYFARGNIDNTIRDFLKKLFDSDMDIGLNLRNDIMHCNTNKLYEPSDFPITTIMLHILVLTLRLEIFN